MRVIRASLILAVLASACFEPVEQEPGCVEGASAECACAAGRRGVQVCNAQGKFDPCVCEAASGDGGSGLCGAMTVPCSADATCVDAGTTSHCECNEGFSGDGVTCTTVGECPVGHCLVGGTCVRDTDEQLCAALGVACGIGSATDSCGQARVVTCGNCVRNGSIPAFPSTQPVLQCNRGFYEPGNPNSQYAFNVTDTYPTVGFLPGGLDAQAQPLPEVTLDIRTDPHPAGPLAFVRGDAGTNAYVAVGNGPVTVTSGPYAALRNGNDLVVDFEAQAYTKLEPSFPTGYAYVKCFGQTEIEAPETDPEFCQSHFWACDALTATDRTGRLRSAACGTCMPPQQCMPSTFNDQPARFCQVCTPETDPAFCSRLGNDCGSVTASDNCGAPRTVNCGACTSPLTCGGGGQPNVCGGSTLSCSWGRTITGPPQPGSFCPNDPPGTTVDGTVTLTQLTFLFNPQSSWYETTINVPSIVSGNVKFYLYTAQDTTVYWSEISGSGSRNGNAISFNQTSQRSSPMGCSNSFKWVACSGTVPFVFGP